MPRASPGRKPNRERHRQVAELRRRGWTVRALGRHLGISHQRVFEILRTSGLPSDLPPIRCAACGAEIGPRCRAGVPAGRMRCLRCLGATPAARFGQRLRACRLRAGLTQRELADRCDLARPTIGARQHAPAAHADRWGVGGAVSPITTYENGRRTPTRRPCSQL
jgi:transcriptional regulator with XRE-family HTH domain